MPAGMDCASLIVVLGNCRERRSSQTPPCALPTKQAAAIDADATTRQPCWELLAMFSPSSGPGSEAAFQPLPECLRESLLQDACMLGRKSEPRERAKAPNRYRNWIDGDAFLLSLE